VTAPRILVTQARGLIKATQAVMARIGFRNARFRTGLTPGDKPPALSPARSTCCLTPLFPREESLLLLCDAPWNIFARGVFGATA